MNILLLAACAYLLTGAIAIILLELLTKRVSGRLRTAAGDTQTLTGGGIRVALVITVIALWSFWPFAIYAALFKRRGRGGKNGTQGSREAGTH